MMEKENKKRRLMVESAVLVFLLGIMFLIQNKIGTYPMRIIMLCLIYIIPSIGMNIIYGTQPGDYSALITSFFKYIFIACLPLYTCEVVMLLNYCY